MFVKSTRPYANIKSAPEIGESGGEVKPREYQYISQDSTSETMAHLLSVDLWLKGQEQPTVTQTGRRRSQLRKYGTDGDK